MTAYAMPGGDPTDVMGRRIFAYIIDGLIGLVIFGALFVPVARSYATEQTFSSNEAARAACELVNPRETTTDANGRVVTTSTFKFDGNTPFCVPVGDTAYVFTADDASSVQRMLYLISFGSTGVNLLLIQGLAGGSVGKLIVGLRVVRQDGSRAGIGWCALRWIILPVDSFCCALVGLITAFKSRGHRRIGDMAAGTLVVRKSAMGAPVQVPGLTSGYGTGGYNPGGGYPPGGYPQQPGYGQPPGYGQQPYGQPGYGQPAAPTPPTAPGAPPAAGGGEGPTWDEARNAYIQYDRDQGQWVQWNDATGSWGPISQ